VSTHRQRPAGDAHPNPQAFAPIGCKLVGAFPVCANLHQAHVGAGAALAAVVDLGAKAGLMDRDGKRG